MDQKKTGQFLKTLRNEKGLTQEQLAQKFNVSNRSVSRWETGTNLPDISLLVEIADFYDVDVREIIDGGILLSAIIAAAMSTADSQLLVASSAFTSDIYKPLIRKDKASDKEMLWLGRIVVLIVAVVAFFIARIGLDNDKSWAADIMNMVENAWGLFGAAFGP